jgi:hypothetical protein
LHGAEVGIADGFGGREGEPAGERGNPRKQRLLVVGEQLVAPIECRLQGPLAPRCVAGAGAEHG